MSCDDVNVKIVYHSLTGCCCFYSPIGYSISKGDKENEIPIPYRIKENQKQWQKYCHANGEDKQSKPLHVFHNSARYEATDCTSEGPHCHCKSNIL